MVFRAFSSPRRLLRNYSGQPYGSNPNGTWKAVTRLLAGTFHEPSKEMAQSNKQQTSARTENPKLDPNPPTNTQKQPDEWVSGDDPMTGAQASYLKTLCEEAGDPDAYDETLTKAEASKRIDALKQELGLE
jgi:hypothetical protein